MQIETDIHRWHLCHLWSHTVSEEERRADRTAEIMRWTFGFISLESTMSATKGRQYDQYTMYIKQLLNKQKTSVTLPAVTFCPLLIHTWFVFTQPYRACYAESAESEHALSSTAEEISDKKGNTMSIT